MNPDEFTRIRKAAGLSQEKLALLLGLQGSRTVRRYEAAPITQSARLIPPPVARLMRMIEAGHLGLIVDSASKSCNNPNAS